MLLFQLRSCKSSMYHTGKIQDFNTLRVPKNKLKQIFFYLWLRREKSGKVRRGGTHVRGRLLIKASDRQTDRQAVKRRGDQKELISLLPDNATLIYASPIKASGWPSRAALFLWDPLVCSAHHLGGEAVVRGRQGWGSSCKSLPISEDHNVAVQAALRSVDELTLK